MFGRLKSVAVAALALMLGQTGLAMAQSEELADFYAGSTVTILIGHPPGGSYDLYAQLASRHLGKHIPGNPQVIVQHMPGGGGSLAAAHFANRAERDGSIIAILPESLASKQLLDPENSRWDLNEMKYIGAFNDVRSVMMVRKDAKSQTVEDLKTIGGAVSCTGQTSTSAQTGAVIKFFADLKLTMVCGYDGSTSAILAMLRGETDLTSTVWTTWKVNHQTELEAGDIKPILQFGLKPIQEIADVPLALDLVDDPQSVKALEFFAASGEIGRALLAPPELEEAKLAMFRQAFGEMMEDPEFLEDAESKNIPLSPMDADELQQNVDRILTADPAVVSLLQEALEKGFQ